MKRILISLIVSVCVLNSVQATEQIKEKIKTILTSNQTDSEKVSLLEEYRTSVKKESEDLKLEYYKFLHNYYYEEYKEEQAVILADEIIEIYEKNEDFENAATYYIKKAEDLPKSKVKEAEELAEKAIDIAKRINNNNLLLFAYINKAGLLTDQNKYVESLKILQMAEVLIEYNNIKDLTLKRELFSEISFIEKKIGNIDRAKKYNAKVIEMKRMENVFDYNYFVLLKNRMEYYLSKKEKEDLIKSLIKLSNENKKMKFKVDIMIAEINFSLNNKINELENIEKLINFESIVKSTDQNNDIYDKPKLYLLKIKVLNSLNMNKEALDFFKNNKDIINDKIGNYLLLMYNEIGDTENALKELIIYDEKQKKENIDKIKNSINDIKEMLEEVAENKSKILKNSMEIMEEKTINNIESEKKVSKNTIMFLLLIMILILLIINIFYISFNALRKKRKMFIVDSSTSILSKNAIYDLAKKEYVKINKTVTLMIIEIVEDKKNCENNENIVIVKAVKIIKKIIRKEDNFGIGDGKKLILMLNNNKREIEQIGTRIEKELNSDYIEVKVNINIYQKNNTKKISFEDFVKNI